MYDKSIYCGTKEQVEFFEYIIGALGLTLDYEVVVVDGEYEIIID